MLGYCGRVAVLSLACEASNVPPGLSLPKIGFKQAAIVTSSQPNLFYDTNPAEQTEQPPSRRNGSSFK
jgi:hypothetical protein